MTREQIVSAVMKLDPGLDPSDEAFKAQVVLMASAAEGPNIRRLAVFTGYPRKLVEKFGHNLRKNGVWVGGKVRANWAEEDGSIEFVMDSMVALGVLERAHQ